MNAAPLASTYARKSRDVSRERLGVLRRPAILRASHTRTKQMRSSFSRASDRISGSTDESTLRPKSASASDAASTSAAAMVRRRSRSNASFASSSSASTPAGPLTSAAGHAVSFGSSHSRARSAAYTSSTARWTAYQWPPVRAATMRFRSGSMSDGGHVHLRAVPARQTEQRVREERVAEEEKYPRRLHAARDQVVLEREVPVGRPGGVLIQRGDTLARDLREVARRDSARHRVPDEHVPRIQPSQVVDDGRVEGLSGPSCLEGREDSSLAGRPRPDPRR